MAVTTDLGEKDLMERAREGAPHGTAVVVPGSDGQVTVEVLVRPAATMMHLVGVPYVAALGVAEALGGLGAAGAGVGWPHDVVCDAGRVADVSATAGFGQGMFAVCRVALDLGRVDGSAMPEAEVVCDAIRDGVVARMDAWSADVSAGRAVAGPLAPVLNDYFDHCPLMGHDVELVYPNGNLFARGLFCGVDVWGRATVRTASGRELEVSEEQCSMRPDPGE